MLVAQWYVGSFLARRGQQAGMLPGDPQLQPQVIHLLSVLQWFQLWFWKEICITTEAVIPTNEK